MVIVWLIAVQTTEWQDVLEVNIRHSFKHLLLFFIWNFLHKYKAYFCLQFSNMPFVNVSFCHALCSILFLNCFFNQRFTIFNGISTVTVSWCTPLYLFYPICLINCLIRFIRVKILFVQFKVELITWRRTVDSKHTHAKYQTANNLDYWVSGVVHF